MASTYSESSPLVVGFDLDMTLVDTREGIQKSLEGVAEETGADINVDGIVSRLGPPIEEALTEYFPEDEVAPAANIFRKHMRRIGVQAVQRFDGADDALGVVREYGGRCVVLTTKQQSLAVATLHYAGLVMPEEDIHGGLNKGGKAQLLGKLGAWGYVDDHINGMEAAKQAHVKAIGVSTGGCSREELVDAGADIVLPSLKEFREFFTNPVRR